MRKWIISAVISLFLFGNGLNVSAQEILLANERSIRIEKDGSVELLSENGELLSHIELDGKVMHYFLVSHDELIVQTDKLSLTLSINDLTILEQLEIPKRLTSSNHFYYFKLDSFLVDISFNQGMYLLNYKNEAGTIQVKRGSSYQQDLPQKALENQEIYDINNQIFYFNFPNSSMFYKLDFKRNLSVNGYVKSKVTVNNLISTYWFLDAKTEVVYFLAQSETNKRNELYSFPNGLPKPEKTWVSNGIKMAKDGTIWKDHNLLYKEIDFVPRNIFGGDLRK